MKKTLGMCCALFGILKNIYHLLTINYYKIYLIFNSSIITCDRIKYEATNSSIMSNKLKNKGLCAAVEKERL